MKTALQVSVEIELLEFLLRQEYGHSFDRGKIATHCGLNGLAVYLAFGNRIAQDELPYGSLDPGVRWAMYGRLYLSAIGEPDEVVSVWVTRKRRFEGHNLHHQWAGAEHYERTGDLPSNGWSREQSVCLCSTQ